MELTGSIITLIGAVFLFLGALGIVRMPDVYNRMQAGTKATTLGTLLFLGGMALGHIECTCVGRTLILILFIIFTNPISSHALARAAHYIGIPLTSQTVSDQLANDEQIEKETNQ
jgi:multicomponent Na+:H+ antiporter subunit G